MSARLGGHLGGWGLALALGLLCGCGERLPVAGPSYPGGVPNERPPGAETSRGGRITRRDDPVLDGLRWLAAHQCSDGQWDPEGFASWCDGRQHRQTSDDDAGLAQHDVAATALALLALLGAGYTERGDHQFALVVRRGLRWLRAQQAPTGLITTHGHPTWMWDHALATLALVQAYGLTESGPLIEPAGRALNALSRERDAGGVWRYGTRAGGLEESLTLWAVMPILSAKHIQNDAVRRGKSVSLNVDTAAIEAARAWLANNTDSASGLLTLGHAATGSRELPGSDPLTLGALGLLVRAMDCQDGRAEGPFKRGLQSLDAQAPKRRGTPEDPDDLVWWAGTQVAFLGGGGPWQRWDAALQAEVTAAQARGEDICKVRGSWAPQGATGRLGGRVVASALLTMSHELYYRYDRQLFPCPPPLEPLTSAAGSAPSK